MKETLILFIKELGIVWLCAILGVAALTVTYFIPRDRMRENVWASSIALHKEGLGAHVWQDIEETMLDIYTDGLMLNVSYTETKDGVRDILLGTHVEVDGINPMESLYEVVALSNDDYIVKNYGRYWHGYQVLLRPLLCLAVCMVLFRKKSRSGWSAGSSQWWEWFCLCHYIRLSGICLPRIIPAAIPILHGGSWGSVCLAY